MKTEIKIMVFSILLMMSFPTYSEENSFIEEDSSDEYVETSDNINSNLDERVKSRTETNKYRYDVEIYPYVSIKFTSTKTKKEDLDYGNNLLN